MHCGNVWRRLPCDGLSGPGFTGGCTIKPFSEGGDDERQNGLLLRADIHTLFDLDLLGIEPEQLRIELHPSVADEGEYTALVGKELQCPR